MSKIQRLKALAYGIITLLLGIFLFSHPERGLEVISVLASLSLTVLGISRLIFYARMARHMVGGINSLIIGFFLTDLGIYAFMLKNLPSAYITIYLLVIHGFSGVVDIMGAIDALRTSSSSWRLKFITGLGNLSLAITAGVYGLFFNDLRTVVFIYAAGLCYSGIMKIFDAFRRTAVAYIQ